jgi:hypothetical protein
MKKLVLSLAILGFVAFGALSVQNLIASSSQIEMVNFDKDPKKDSNKKAADTKDVKAETKTTEADAKASPSTCSDKSSCSKSCCGAEKEGCAKSCPDKK